MKNSTNTLEIVMVGCAEAEKPQDEFSGLIDHYLGSPATDEEIIEATIVATQKCEQIIARFGDLNGERNQPYYHAQLVAEQIRSSRLSQFLRLVELDRERIRAI